jgi:hypothetical protein
MSAAIVFVISALAGKNFLVCYCRAMALQRD